MITAVGVMIQYAFQQFADRKLRRLVDTWINFSGSCSSNEKINRDIKIISKIVPYF